jgi:hypothetical protein
LARTFLRLFLLVLCLTPAGFAQQTPAWEIFGGYSFERSVVREYYKSTPIIYTFREDYLNLNGWELSVTENVNRRFGGTFQLTGHYKSPVFRGTKSRQNMFSIMYGPRFTQRAGWITLYEHVLFGANRTSVVVSPGPHATETEFAVAAGLGLDVNLGSKAAIRVFQAQYSPTNPIVSRDHKFQASAGLVFYLGKTK